MQARISGLLLLHLFTLRVDVERGKSLCQRFGNHRIHWLVIQPRQFARPAVERCGDGHGYGFGHGGIVAESGGGRRRRDGRAVIRAARSLAYNPGTGNLYAVDANTNQVYVVNTRNNNRYAGALTVGSQDPNDGGQGIAVINNKVYVGNWQGRSITVLDDSGCVR